MKTSLVSIILGAGAFISALVYCIVKWGSQKLFGAKAKPGEAVVAVQPTASAETERKVADEAVAEPERRQFLKNFASAAAVLAVGWTAARPGTSGASVFLAEKLKKLNVNRGKSLEVNDRGYKYKHNDGNHDDGNVHADHPPVHVDNTSPTGDGGTFHADLTRHSDTQRHVDHDDSSC